ncbi:MAG: tetratricopeptide repeat protein [Candidatus Omnitrophota bacterium]
MTTVVASLTCLILVIVALCAGTVAADNVELQDAFTMLKARKDKQAQVILEEVLMRQPQNLEALWGKAEILRRGRKFRESEALFNLILKKNPQYPPALLGLAYIRYNDNNLKEALQLVKRALKSEALTKDNKALAFMMLGSINSKRSTNGWVINKIQYGIQIKSYFLKAAMIAPELAEVHLGLGTFYLKAPVIAGGSLDKAIEELETAIKLAPEFATAAARLAQAYKKKNNPEKYNFYLQRAKELDPENEALQELADK